MAALDKIQPDASELLAEIEAFRRFLSSNRRAERAEFLPFFAGRKQLCAQLATLLDRVSFGNCVATEMSLWGDFKCDLVSGNPNDRGFILVEFEDASPTSLFRPIKGRKNNCWGSRVEAGLSQVIDWLFRIDGEGSSDRMERDFGVRHFTKMGIVVVGRSAEVSPYDRARLEWRSENTVVAGAKVVILTYDDLLQWLDGRAFLIRLPRV